MAMQKMRDIRSYALDKYDVKTIRLGKWRVTIGYNVKRFKKEWSFNRLILRPTEFYLYTQVFALTFDGISVTHEFVEDQSKLVYSIFNDFKRTSAARSKKSA